MAEYEKDFSKLYYDESLEESDSDFELIDNLFYLIDSYEPNKKLREEFSDYIDEKQLRERVKEYQTRIEACLKEKKINRELKNEK